MQLRCSSLQHSTGLTAVMRTPTCLRHGCDDVLKVLLPCFNHAFHEGGVTGYSHESTECAYLLAFKRAETC